MGENPPPPGFSDDVDSCCSTPFVSAPSSPGRDIPLGGFYYSAPSSPMHFVLSTASLKSSSYSAAASDSSFEFDLPSTGAASADELFFNGQIRPMKLSTHLRRPQFLGPLIESDGAVEEDENQTQTFTRGRDLKLRAGSLRRRTKSMSPLRKSTTTSFQWDQDDEEEQSSNRNQIDEVDFKIAENLEEDNEVSVETTPCASRSSSAGRNSSSKRWIFLKEFLSRSKSEGRNHDRHKFWGSISLKDKKPLQPLTATRSKGKEQIAGTSRTGEVKKRTVNNKNGAGKITSPSPHELHYTAKRAQAEEMKKRTFLPYRQGLLSCLSFGSKSYGAMNGIARALNPVSSS